MAMVSMVLLRMIYNGLMKLVLLVSVSVLFLSAVLLSLSVLLLLQLVFSTIANETIAISYWYCYTNISSAAAADGRYCIVR